MVLQAELQETAWRLALQRADNVKVLDDPKLLKRYPKPQCRLHLLRAVMLCRDVKISSGTWNAGHLKRSKRKKKSADRLGRIGTRSRRRRCKHGRPSVSSRPLLCPSISQNMECSHTLLKNKINCAQHLVVMGDIKFTIRCST